MSKKEKICNPAIKYGHGLNRAKKVENKDTKTLRHKKKWVEDKMDNK